ncbi:hypothetical protein EJB05_16058, partial [Eragrostis curvula]
MERAVDWTALPADALRCIAGRISDPVDFINFRFVCTEWHEEVLRNDHGRFGPWIVEKGEEADDSGNVLFYSLASGEYHMIHVESLEGKRVAGYGAGLLLGIDTDDALSAVLVNPLTGEGTVLPRLPECFLGTYTYGFATDPKITGEEDVFVVVYNWPTVQARSNVALWRGGAGAGTWATIRSERFWMDMPRYRDRLVAHGPQLLQQFEEQAAAMANGHAPGAMAWVPGMEGVHVIEHQGRVRKLARQELVVNAPAIPPRANFVLRDIVGGVDVAWADAPELRDKVILQSEDCSCYVLPASDFPNLSNNSVYFLSWERRDEVNLQEDGAAGGDDDDVDNPFSYYLCKWDVIDRVATVVKKVPGVWDRVRPGMWFMPTLAY